MPRRISVLTICSLLCMAMPTAALAWGNYSINGDSIAPIEVFDNGEKTFFRFAASDASVLPVILSFGASGKAVEKYRQRDGYLVVDRIASRFELVFGDYHATVINNNLPGAIVSKPADDMQSSGAVGAKQGTLSVEAIEQRQAHAMTEPARLEQKQVVMMTEKETDAVRVDQPMSLAPLKSAANSSQLPATAPTAPSVPQAIEKGYSIPQGSFRDAFAAVAKHYGIDLVWDAQKPAEEDRFDRSIKFDGLGLVEDLKHLEALLNKGKTITHIDAYLGNNVLYVRSL